MPDVTAFMTTCFSLFFLEWTVRWKWYWVFNLYKIWVCTLHSFSWWTANKRNRLIRTSESFKTSFYLHMHLVCIVISKTRWDTPTILVVPTAGNFNTRWSVMQLAGWGFAGCSKLCAMKPWVQHKFWPVFVWSRIFLPCLICCSVDSIT